MKKRLLHYLGLLGITLVGLFGGFYSLPAFDCTADPHVGTHFGIDGCVETGNLLLAQILLVIAGISVLLLIILLATDIVTKIRTRH